MAHSTVVGIHAFSRVCRNVLHWDFLNGCFLGGTNDREGKLKHTYRTKHSAQIHKALLIKVLFGEAVFVHVVSVRKTPFPALQFLVMVSLRSWFATSGLTM